MDWALGDTGILGTTPEKSTLAQFGTVEKVYKSGVGYGTMTEQVVLGM